VIERQEKPPLAPYRVLDLTDEKGLLCGQILGFLGADVLKIEKPGGDPARRFGPFYKDIPDPQKSLYWFAFNTNKRGITLDLETSDGREIFMRLVKTSDFVIESFRPGYMEQMELGYNILSEANPRIIMTRITPFGQEGPYRDYKVTDFIMMAMGGLVFLTGAPDRPPVGLSIPQAYLHAGIQAAAGTMVAHYYRELTEKGQCVDVSIQKSVYYTAIPEPRIPWEFAGMIGQRTGKVRVGAVQMTTIWQCKDGYVAFRIMTGMGVGRKTQHLVEWMDSESRADALVDIDWEAVDAVNLTQQETGRWEKIIADFFLSHTKSELYERALTLDFMLFPVMSAENLLKDDQLAYRNYFTPVKHPELGTEITYPGAPFKSTLAFPVIRNRPPLIGEHNREIYEGELGFSSTQLSCLKANNII